METITTAVISTARYLADNGERNARLTKQKCTHKTSKIKHIMHSRVRTHARTHAHTQTRTFTHIHRDFETHAYTRTTLHDTKHPHTHARTERM